MLVALAGTADTTVSKAGKVASVPPPAIELIAPAIKADKQSSK